MMSRFIKMKGKSTFIFYKTSRRSSLISEIRSLSADCLPNRIKASVCGVLASQLFGRGVANFFKLMRVHKTVNHYIKNHRVML
ncbi:hypothetical protein ACIQWQ_01250 [Peribacillus frigoritolerans]